MLKVPSLFFNNLHNQNNKAAHIHKPVKWYILKFFFTKEKFTHDSHKLSKLMMCENKTRPTVNMSPKSGPANILTSTLWFNGLTHTETKEINTYVY